MILAGEYMLASGLPLDALYRAAIAPPACNTARPTRQVDYGCSTVAVPVARLAKNTIKGTGRVCGSCHGSGELTKLDDYGHRTRITCVCRIGRVER